MTAVVERLELGSGFEMFGLDFWTKNQQIKATVTDGEELACNGQGFRNNQKICSMAKKRSGIPVFLKTKTLSCVKAAW